VVPFRATPEALQKAEVTGSTKMMIRDFQ